MKKRCVLIGCGVISAYYKRGLLESEDLDLQAICDTDVNCKSRSVYIDFPFYTDLQEIIDDIKPRIAIISVGAKKNLDVIKKCIDNDVSVIVEKPIASNYEDFVRINEIKKSANTFIYGMHHWQYADETLFLSSNIHKYGKIKKIQVEIHDDYACDNGCIKANRYRLCGAWNDSGINALSYINSFFDVENLKLTSKKESTDMTANQVYYVSRTYIDTKKDVQVEITVDWSKNSREKTSKVVTDQGVIEINHNQQKIYFNKNMIFHENVQDRLEKHYINILKNMRYYDDNLGELYKIYKILYDIE